MSSLPDRELETWIADWQEEPELGAEVREAIHRRVRRRGVGLALLTAFELAFAAAMLVFLLRFALTHPHPSDVATMSGLSLLVVGALAFGVWNRRGVWRPSAQTTAAFLDLAIVRCRRRLRSVRFGYGLLATEVVLFVPWLGFHLATDPPGASWLTGPLGAYGFLAAVAGVALAALLVLGRGARRELAALNELRRATAQDEHRSSGL